MSVEFEDEVQESRALYSRFMPSSQVPKLVGWVISTGIVKNENQANKLLLGVALTSMILALLIVTGFWDKMFQPAPTYLEDIPEEIRLNLPPDILREIPSRN